MFFFLLFYGGVQSGKYPGEEGSQTKRRVLDKYDNIRTEKPAETFSRIRFTASC